VLAGAEDRFDSALVAVVLVLVEHEGALGSVVGMDSETADLASVLEELGL